MNAGMDVYSGWDAAYVLGALSPEERHDFERHLGGCKECSRSVSELAGLPGLLAAVPVEQALLLDSPDGAAGDSSREGDMPRKSATTLPRLLTAARRQRRRARALVAGALVVVAAAAASVALVLPGWIGTPDRETTARAVTLEQVVPNPLSADIRLTGESWGTRIDSRCSYAKTGYGAGEQAYGMYVTDRQGRSVIVATWLAGPGTTVTPVGTTSTAAQDIATVDIRSLKTGQVLLESGLVR